jgi:hypothetical protein
MMTPVSCMARTADPSARKAGFEAMQRMDKTRKEPDQGTKTPSNNYGSWGPVFQNKNNFASMHWC